VLHFASELRLAYFGWPQAHEDDAERAVRAGLALVQTVGALEVSGRRLAARIGIATGLVVVGEPVGQGEAQERAVVGEKRSFVVQSKTAIAVTIGTGVLAVVAITAVGIVTSTVFTGQYLPIGRGHFH
jgi:Adenylate and Guanylate cyclase catalytic domain